MPVELSNIPGRSEPQGFVHVGVASGSRTVYVAGQVSQDAEGETVAKGDLAGQTEQALLNVVGALESVGAAPAKPSTLIGVAALFSPDYLIEIDATAVLA